MSSSRFADAHTDHARIVLTHRDFHKAIWAPAVRRAGLPPGLRIHDLRHLRAPAHQQGAHVKAIQRHLGHSSQVVTLNTYSHQFPEELDRLAKSLDETRARALAAPPRPGPTWNVVKLDERQKQNRAVTRNSVERRAWDSNPQALSDNGFQDRPLAN